MNITQIYENYLRALDYFKAHSDEAWFDGQKNAHEQGKFVKIPLKNLLKSEGQLCEWDLWLLDLEMRI